MWYSKDLMHDIFFLEKEFSFHKQRMFTVHCLLQIIHHAASMGCSRTFGNYHMPPERQVYLTAILTHQVHTQLTDTQQIHAP